MSLLPKTKSKAKTDFAEYTILIYGAPKAGKSTLAAAFDAPIFIATENGLNALETFNIQVSDWETFLLACGEIAEGKHGHKTVVIDTVDNLFKFCSNFICKKQGIAHESELEWGKGWKLVKDEFFRAITKLSQLPYGLLMISHADASEIKTRTGSITKWIPSMAKQARETILPICDFVFFATSEVGTDGERRILKTKPSENWEAGDRTGKLAPVLPMNYQAIKTAFDAAILNNGGK